jgi:hypothetical protein
MGQLQILQTHIDTLREYNRLDWLKLAMSSLLPDSRLEIREKIAARDVDLWSLIQEKWAQTALASWNHGPQYDLYRSK